METNATQFRYAPVDSKQQPLTAGCKVRFTCEGKKRTGTIDSIMESGTSAWVYVTATGETLGFCCWELTKMRAQKN